MSRLDAVRTFFIEQFLNSIAADPGLGSISHPSDVFDANGQFNVPVDVNGFRRIPTVQNLRRRIAESSDPQEVQDLSVFLQIVLRATAYVTGGLGTLELSALQALAVAYAPIIRQHVDQSFFPSALKDYLNYSDGTLRATYHDDDGTVALRGKVFDLMFANPAIPQAPAFPEAPYRARVPFVSTVGVDPGTEPYPASPLSAGRLNLSAADPRFGPGRQSPTLYAELKSLTGSLFLNRLYETYSQQSGRFAPLRNNRIHLDPLVDFEEKKIVGIARTTGMRPERAGERHESEALSELTRLVRAASRFIRIDPRIVEERFESIREALNHSAASNSAPSGIRRLTATARDLADSGEQTPATYLPQRTPLLLVYHAFYPADDEARKRGNVSGTNREGHHLATGVMFMPYGRSNALSLVPTHVFHCGGPDDIRIYPFDHPILQRLDDEGAEADHGRHLVLYSKWNSPLALVAGGLAGGGTAIIAREAGAGDEYVAALSTLAAIAATAAASGAWPVAVAAVVLFVFVLLMCVFTGCGSSDGASSTASGPGSIRRPLSADPGYQDPVSHVTPPGSPAAGTPMRLEVIPHLLERNLYGLHGGGEDTFDVVDDPELKEMLGWVGFPGGLGYQLEREMPGKQDVSGSSWRNYFDLFVVKFLRIEQAKRDVTYFGD